MAFTEPAEDSTMKRLMDDTAIWQFQQKNTSKSFPYVFPQMPLPTFFIVTIVISLLFSLLTAPLGFTPGLFWRCPCCGHPFPYYAPTRGDNLKEKECLLSMEGQHIKYAKLKFCPLIIPSVCSEYKCKFFDVADYLL